MADAALLQPSLLDRLEDQLRGVEIELGLARNRLSALLDEDERASLGELLDHERGLTGPPTPDQLRPFARLQSEARELLLSVLDLNQKRGVELRRHLVISRERLAQIVVRDLECLFNTDRYERESLLYPDNPRHVCSLDDFPHVKRSVINYGIPSFAGKITGDLIVEALEREMESVIRIYEPRLRGGSVRVRAIVEPDNPAHEALVFEIDAELWAVDMPLKLLLRTLIDLDDGAATVSARSA